MNKEIFTSSTVQTKKLGENFAKSFRGGEILCLSGELGAGKTTFTQGLLKGLGIKGPYTSPTFAILKVYKAKNPKVHKANVPPSVSSLTAKQLVNNQPLSVYHIDAYRIKSKDLHELGFKDFAGKKNSVTIIEWPEKVKRIIPTGAVWINFQWLSDKQRKITVSKKER